MPQDNNIPEDPEKDAQLQNVMAQIKALESKVPVKALPAGGEVSPLGSDTTTPSPPPVPASQSPPAAPAKKSRLNVHDVVEVTNKENRYYGVLFKLGAMKDREAHGYVLKENGAREYVTVKLGDVTFVGECRIRLKNPCSDKWIGQHGE